MVKVMSIQNEKGGGGKTQSAVNIAFGLSNAGLRVLLVDLDPQANATSIILKQNKKIDLNSLNKMKQVFDEKCSNGTSTLQSGRFALNDYVSKRKYKIDVSEVLIDPKCVREAIIQSDYPNLHIIPSSHALSEADMELKKQCRRSEERLRMAIDIVQDDYDAVVIDNSPFINALTYNAINSCYRKGDTIIIPIKVDQGGLEGLDNTVTLMLEWLEYGYLDYDFKILFTMTRNNRIDKETVATIKYLFKDRVFDTVIRDQAKPVTESGFNKEILINEHAPNGRLKNKGDNCWKGVAEDYKCLVKEILEEIKQ